MNVSSSHEDSVSSGNESINKSSSDESNNSLTANIQIENDEDVSSTTERVEGSEIKEPKTRKTFGWSTVARFQTYTEAHNSILAEHFKKHGTKKGSDGSKINYRCGKIKQKSKVQCEAKRRIVQSVSTADFVVESNNATHTCESIDASHQAKSVSEEMKQMIINCAANRMTPKYIITHINTLRENHGLFLDEETPNIPSIYYILKANKSEKTPKIQYLGQLVEWCESNMEVPSDMDQPFVIGFEHSDEGEELHFKVVVTTKRLLEHCAGITHLCVDGTYKLNWHEWPFMVIGTVDKDKRLHPLCFALCTNEATPDFEFIFETLSTNVKKHTSKEFRPTILISDASNAIRNAFMSVFPFAILMIMCYTHVLRNVGKHKEKYKKENKDEIFKDIEILHQSSCLHVFKILSRLFLKKWNRKEPEFARYFERQWLQSHCNWYLGAAAYTPTTNNAVEGKIQQTFPNVRKFNFINFTRFFDF